MQSRVPRPAWMASVLYAVAILIALFVGGLVPVLIVGAMLVGLSYAATAGTRGPGRDRNRNRNRNRDA